MTINVSSPTRQPPFLLYPLLLASLPSLFFILIIVILMLPFATQFCSLVEFRNLPDAAAAFVMMFVLCGLVVVMVLGNKLAGSKRQLNARIYF